MTPLIEAVRQIGRDLVAKRLWPIALALLAALVAVPVVIGSSGSDASVPGPVAAGVPAVAPATSPAIAGDKVQDPAPPRGGKVGDPFYDPPKAPAEPGDATATSTGGGATQAVAGAPADKGAAPSRDAAAVRAPAPTTATAPKPAQTSAPRRGIYHRTVVRWGSSLDAPSHAIARLTPLGGSDAPAAVYLGPTRADRLWAVFVLGPNATWRGDGICKAGTGCRMIGLKAGDRQRVSVHGSDGKVVRRYWLRVRSVKTVATTARAARSGRVKVHPDGRAVLREMRRDPIGAAVLGNARYDRSSGLLDATGPAAGVEQATK